MKPFRKSLAPVAAIAVGVALTLTACGSSDSDKSSASSTSAAPASSAAPTSKQTSEEKTKPTEAEGANYTIADYIRDSKIVETAVQRGDENAPVIDLPFPPGWENAGKNTPEGAYGAIAYTGPDAGSYQPSIIAILSKLEGPVDTQKLIDYAGNEVKNLQNYEEVQPPTPSTFAGFPALAVGGTHTEDGKELLVAQKTVVITGKDGLYILQLNLDATPEQVDIVNAATTEINANTKITP